MTTPLTITSLSQGKIYRDWTQKVAYDTHVPATVSARAHETSSMLQTLRGLIKAHGQQLAAATRFTIWHAH